MQLVTLVKEGLRDFSISRSAVDWGIRFDQDPQHTVYVWFDALNGEQVPASSSGCDALQSTMCCIQYLLHIPTSY